VMQTKRALSQKGTRSRGALVRSLACMGPRLLRVLGGAAVA
jgi:hypothetical protein